MSEPRTYIKRTLVFTDDDEHTKEHVWFSNDVEYGYALNVSASPGLNYLSLVEVDALIEFLEDLRYRARHKERR